MTPTEFEALLMNCFADWGNTCGSPISPVARKQLRDFIDGEFKKEENSHRIYPQCISEKLTSWFPVEQGYGLEDIVEFARFLQDEVGVC